MLVFYISRLAVYPVLLYKGWFEYPVLYGRQHMASFCRMGAPLRWFVHARLSEARLDAVGRGGATFAADPACAYPRVLGLPHLLRCKARCEARPSRKVRVCWSERGVDGIKESEGRGLRACVCVYGRDERSEEEDEDEGKESGEEVTSKNAAKEKER